MSETFSIISLGCFRNSYDSEIVANRFLKKGGIFKKNPQKVHTLIINTCGFIKEAKEESLEVIKEALELKKAGRIKEILVKGCLVTRYKDELKKHFPEIDNWEEIEPLEKKFVERKRISPSHLGFLKISEGCINRCSYCAIPLIKGSLRSRPVESIVAEAQFLDRSGVKELNIIGQDISSWGEDIYKNKDLAYLLKKIVKSTQHIKWIRLLYTHPRHFTDSLIKVIADEERICKYIDLPIQHINNRILKLMNRGVTRKDIVNLIERIRKRIPHCVLRTSLIVGFPTETEKEFEELLDFVGKIRFERLGAFIYSREEGTPAYNFSDQIHPNTKKRRYNELMSLQRDISREANQRFVDKKLNVLVEEKEEDGFYVGRTEFSCYDIDGVVYLKKRGLKIGSFYKAKIVDAYEYDLLGE